MWPLTPRVQPSAVRRAAPWRPAEQCAIAIQPSTRVERTVACGVMLGTARAVAVFCHGRLYWVSDGHVGSEVRRWTPGAGEVEVVRRSRGKTEFGLPTCTQGDARRPRARLVRRWCAADPPADARPTVTHSRSAPRSGAEQRWHQPGAGGGGRGAAEHGKPRQRIQRGAAEEVADAGGLDRAREHGEGPCGDLRHTLRPSRPTATNHRQP
jgi:hypothetical protein